METYEYDVIVETPMGEKDGHTVLHLDGDKVSGTLALLGKVNEFDNGTWDRNGTGEIEFAGKMHTPFGKMPFTLKGVIKEDYISGVTYSKIGNFKIRGK